MPLVYCILTFIATTVACYFYYTRQEGRRKLPDDAGLPSQETNRQILIAALQALNCDVRWEKDGEDDVAHFEFQAGHFTARLVKSSPYISLLYLFMYQTKGSDIEIVRHVCNRCNISTESCSVVYTVNEENNNIDIHIVNSLLLSDSTAKSQLKRALEEVFVWQRHLEQSMQHNKNMAADEATSDPEQAHLQRVHEYILLNEQEMRHQEGGEDLRSTPHDALTLGGLIARTLGLDDVEPMQLLVTRDEQTLCWPDDKPILDAPIDAVLIGNGQWAHTTGSMKLRYRHPRYGDRERYLTVDFEQQTTTDDTLYYRATLSLIPQKATAMSAIHDEQLTAQIVSVLIAHELTSAKVRQDELNYLYKEAKAKIDAGKPEELTDDERLLTSFDMPDYGQQALHGRKLYNEGRYYECVQILDDIHRDTQKYYGQMSKSTREAFYGICYYIGACYMQLNQWEKACYYLEMTLPARQYGYTQMYINCLVNGNDFRAMRQIEGYMTEMQQAMQEEGYDNDSLEMRDMTRFLAFLYRRKAYLLVEYQLYDEADELLRKLVKDPESNSFALSELAYVQKKRLEEVTDIPSENADLTAAEAE